MNKSLKRFLCACAFALPLPCAASVVETNYQVRFTNEYSKYTFDGTTALLDLSIRTNSGTGFKQGIGNMLSASCRNGKSNYLSFAVDDGNFDSPEGQLFVYFGEDKQTPDITTTYLALDRPKDIFIAIYPDRGVVPELLERLYDGEEMILVINDRADIESSLRLSIVGDLNDDQRGKVAQMVHMCRIMNPS